MPGEQGDKGRGRRDQIRDMVGRLRWLLIAKAVILLVGATLLFPPRPLLVWNVSASAPLGLYFVGGKGRIERGDLVIARVPAGLRMFAARRSYVPLNVPLVKRVAALAGDTVCASDLSVRVNDKIVAARLAVDARQRAMPRWSGCVDLVEGDYFLLMSDSPASFDGRYFGVSNVSDVVGEARHIWGR